MESSNLYKALFENSYSVMLLINPDSGNIEDANHAACNYYGYDKDKITSMNISDINTLSKEEVFKEMKRAKTEQRNYFNFRHRLLSGEIRDVEVYSGPIDVNEKQLLYSIIHDVTAKKQAEVALKESEERFKKMAEATFEGIIIAEKGKIIDANQQCAEMFGYTHDEILGRDVLDFVAPESRDLVSNMIKEGYQEAYECIALKKDGSRINIEVRGKQITYHGRKARGTSIRNITKQKKAEEALRESEEKFRELAELLPEAIFETDLEGTYTYANRNAFEISGYTLEDINKGLNAYEIFVPEDRRKVLKHFRKTIKGAQIGPREYMALKKDRTRFHVTLSLSLVKRNDEPVGVRGVVIDITERKQMEEQIRQSLLEKDMLIKEIHHRVKNNLSVIQSLLSLQSSQSSDVKTKDALDESKSRVRAISMIHERLYKASDLSSIEFSEYIETLAYELFNNYQTGNNNITLKVDIEKISIDIETIIPCGLIVNELITNALKYAFLDSPGGEIYIAIKYDNIGSVFLVVRDNGVGLPDGFDINKAETLGMQIVQSLSKQIGTDAIVRSDMGGTEFQIQLQKHQLAPLQWDESISLTGHAKIDRHHRELFKEIRNLKEAIEKGRHEAGINYIIPKLIQYANVHFETEESYMREYEFPGIEKHVMAHEEFKTKLDTIVSEIERGKIGLSLSVYDFLVQWFQGHDLADFDRELVAFLDEKGVSGNESDQ